MQQGIDVNESEYGVRRYPIGYDFVGCNNVTRATIDRSNAEVKRMKYWTNSILEKARQEIDSRLYIRQLDNGRFDLEYKSREPEYNVDGSIKEYGFTYGYLNEKSLKVLLNKLDFAIQMVRLARKE